MSTARGQVSTLICTPGAAACATPTPTDAQARSAHGSKTKPASHPNSSSFVASLGPVRLAVARSLSATHLRRQAWSPRATSSRSAARAGRRTRPRKDRSRALTREALSSDRQEPLLRAQEPKTQTRFRDFAWPPRHLAPDPLGSQPATLAPIRRDALIANLETPSADPKPPRAGPIRPSDRRRRNRIL
jgi:hypothetical protein